MIRSHSINCRHRCTIWMMHVIGLALPSPLHWRRSSPFPSASTGTFRRLASFFLSPWGKLACSLFLHKDNEMDMGLVLLMLMNCSFVRLSNQMSLKGTKRDDYSFTSLVILCFVNIYVIGLMLECIHGQTCLLISYDMCFHWLLAAFWGADFSLRRFLRKHSGALALMEIQSRVFQTRLDWYT